MLLILRTLVEDQEVSRKSSEASGTEDEKYRRETLVIMVETENSRNLETSVIKGPETPLSTS